MFSSAKPVPAEVAPTQSYRETAITLYPQGNGFYRQKKLAKIHAQATVNLKQTKFINKIDEFLKHQRYSKLVENVVIKKYLRLELFSEAIPRRRC